MSNVVIVYASHYGQTRAIAERIAEHLRARGAQTDVFDARYATPAPDAYDAAVIGSRVEVGRHASSVIDYITTYRDVLERMPTGFFSVSMAAARPGAGNDPNGYLAALDDQVTWKPTCAAAFAGALKYRKYNWLTRFIMKRISQSAGHTTDTSKNHEFTNWAAVEAFANQVADLLEQPAPSLHTPPAPQPSPRRST